MKKRKKTRGRAARARPIILFVNGTREEANRQWLDVVGQKAAWIIVAATVARSKEYVRQLVEREFVDIQAFDSKGRGWAGRGKFDRVEVVRSKPWRRCVSAMWGGSLMPIG